MSAENTWIFEPQMGTCGACIAFVKGDRRDDDLLGTCRIRPEMGTLPSSLPRCPKYVEKGTGVTWKPPRAVRGRARGWFDDTEVETMGGQRQQRAQRDLKADRGSSQVARSKSTLIRRYPTSSFIKSSR